MNLRLSTSGLLTLVGVLLLAACDPGSMNMSLHPAKLLALPRVFDCPISPPPTATDVFTSPISPLPTATASPTPTDLFTSPISPLPTATWSPTPTSTGTPSPSPTGTPRSTALPAPTGPPPPSPTFTPISEKARFSVTGGGWILSPAGAYTVAPELRDKVDLSFVVQQKKDAGGPTGNVEFHWNAAKVRFHASHLELLAVEGARATFQGTGTLKGLNRKGGVSFCFRVSVIDGQLEGGDSDRVRIRIWAMEDGNMVIYDNQPGDPDDADPTTELGSGSIVIHMKDD
jgi:hypothetical protein